MSAKKMDHLSTVLKRTSDDEWIFSQEVPSDLTIVAAGTYFSLHKFPLVSKSGYIRKEISESDRSVIDISDVPGGASAFELAAKFCYGINFEISIENIAKLRCIAEFLEMTEEYAVGNLVGRTEVYINEVALKSLSGAVSVLHSSEDFLPVAEKVKLVSCCIDTIAFVACKDSKFSAPTRPDAAMKPVVDWWAEDLTILRIDLFQRVLVALMARGFKQYALGPILMLYAQKSLRGLDIFGKKIEPRQEHEKRVILETIVGLLPRDKNSILAVSFLSMLLRGAMYLDTTVACRLDLEKRMGLQLGQAMLDDLLIPSYSFAGDTMFDVDTVQRIMVNFLESEREADRDYISPSQNDMERVTRLLEGYLAEIASDQYLSVSKFISVAELIPEQLRITEDGMYRAVDIYLKAHPALSDLERKKVCGIMDCQKLSREACAHAAQNDRLPVQTVVQVLYYEQQRLREVMDSGSLSEATLPSKLSNVSPDEVSNLRQENQDLKLQLMQMKMRMKEIESSENLLRQPVINSPLPDKPRKSFMSSVSKTLGRFIRADGIMTQGSKGKTRPGKNRRHSVS